MKTLLLSVMILFSTSLLAQENKFKKETEEVQKYFMSKYSSLHEKEQENFIKYINLVFVKLSTTEDKLTNRKISFEIANKINCMYQMADGYRPSNKLKEFALIREVRLDLERKIINNAERKQLERLSDSYLSGEIISSYCINPV